MSQSEVYKVISFFEAEVWTLQFSIWNGPTINLLRWKNKLSDPIESKCGTYVLHKQNQPKRITFSSVQIVCLFYFSSLALFDQIIINHLKQQSFKRQTIPTFKNGNDKARLFRQWLKHQEDCTQISNRGLLILFLLYPQHNYTMAMIKQTTTNKQPINSHNLMPWCLVAPRGLQQLGRAFSIIFRFPQIKLLWASLHCKHYSAWL